MSEKHMEATILIPSSFYTGVIAITSKASINGRFRRIIKKTFRRIIKNSHFEIPSRQRNQNATIAIKFDLDSGKN